MADTVAPDVINGSAMTTTRSKSTVPQAVVKPVEWIKIFLLFEHNEAEHDCKIQVNT